MKRILRTPFILPLILVAAVALVVFKVKNKTPVAHQELSYPVKAVEVIEAKNLLFRARATAYGHVEPATVLKAKAEVSGKVSYLHPELKKGGSLAKGTVVLRIEPTTFEISLDQSKAGLAGSESTLQQLQSEESSTQKTLSIAEQNLAVGLKELKRVQALVKSNLVTRSVVDKESQKVLLLRQQVQDIKGKLDSYASRKSATKAQIRQSQSQVSQSKDTLGRTEVVLPFDARIGDVSVEEGEFTSAGSILFEALGVAAVEINAELPSKQFRPLVAGLGTFGSSVKREMGQQGEAGNNVVDSFNLQNPKRLNKTLTEIGLEATVSLVGDGQSTWQGQLLRISESVDPTRDTLGLTIAVDNPYSGVIPGLRPPLLKGMYTSVALFSPAKSALVLPRKALHQGRVYIADAENKLQIQSVKIQFTQGDLVVLASGDANALLGKRIIITDVIPVMQGMPLKPIVANEFETELARQAMGSPSIANPKSTSDPVSDSASKVAAPEVAE